MEIKIMEDGMNSTLGVMPAWRAAPDLANTEEREEDSSRQIDAQEPSPRERAAGEPGVDPTRREHWPSREAHLRFLIDGGYDLEEGGETEWIPGAFDDPKVRVAQAVRGATRRDYEVVWEYRGASEYLTADHFDLGYGAVAFANCMGLVLNTWTTIVWASVGITGDFAVAQADRRFRELLRKRLVKRGLPVAWLWVLERSAKRGLHAHVLSHVPQVDVYWVKQAIEECVETVAVRPLVRVPGEKTVLVKGRHNRAIGPQWFWFRYMMKGIRPDTVLNDPARPGHFVPLREIAAMRRMDPQGMVRTQRFGVSRALQRLSQARQCAETGLPENALRDGAMHFHELFDYRYYEWSQRDENRRRTEELHKTLVI
ncbi:MAG TPA: hypothetical protein VGU70_19380 [Methylobacterium sp.]|jgi:hypothetical protein|nr:hypothetical protein [Methylobacterium sp.]